ncbi:3D domain-containing protein [Bacillus paralicheniformis]|uniref:Cell wall-binding protein YocH n=1 Tax=Bacillus paralicheniformis TaxID=1648923 RepID=A0ABY3FXR1_9BACI|nr:3D domain-containing protein [Bacillus paralicheniformis]TWL40876.1 Cell wall-binding protein YocH [Bacillus paralicheniformis]WEZ24201.1 3D domain-containing protein [Bacillus paralicheniformis]
MRIGQNGGVSIGILTNFTLTAQLFSGHCPADQPPEPPRITPEQAAIQSAESRSRELTKEITKKDEKIQALEDEIKALKKAKNPTATKTSAWRTFTATAYTAFCSEGCTGITKTGVDVSHSIYYEGARVIAVDPSVIALGSTVEVRLADGSSFRAKAIDTGGAIKGARLDLLVANEADAVQFGRQSVELRVIK